MLRRGGSGPRQPGGGRQIAGPRDHDRGRHAMSRHAEARPQRVSKGGGSRPGRPSSEGSPRRPPQNETAKPLPAAVPTTVQTVAVTPDEANMRVDRFLEARFPGLSFSHIQRIIRKGELRVNGKRAPTNDRLQKGQAVRIPPLRLDAPKVAGELSEAAQKTLAALKEMTLYEDD